MQLTDEYKNQVYKEIGDIMIASLEKEEITNEEVQKSATFILDRIEGIKTFEEWTIFLQELATTWPIYDVIYKKAHGQGTITEDQQKVTDIQSKLQSLINTT